MYEGKIMKNLLIVLFVVVATPIFVAGSMRDRPDHINLRTEGYSEQPQYLDPVEN